MTAASRLDLYWIPLGAGARIVRSSGRAYEASVALLHRRPRRALYHSALIATIAGQRTVIEMAPVPDARGHERGVVGEGPVGTRWAGRLRIFRYEIRCWRGGVIPDLRHAVASPVRITDDPATVQRVLDVLAAVPTPVWGRDELRTGDMWNSNSVVSWVLTSVGLRADAGPPPPAGRAPGWDAGVLVAHRARCSVATSCERRHLRGQDAPA